MTAQFDHDAMIVPEIAPADLADPGQRDAIARFLANHPATTAFHRLEWGEAIAEATGHRFVLLVAREVRQSDAITGLLPCHIVHSSLFGRALVSCGFAVDGGILAADRPTAEALAQAFWRLAASHSCPSAELRGGRLPADDDWTVRTDSYAGFAAPLAQGDDDARLNAVPRKQRAEIRKGLANALTVTIGRDGADRAAHYQVYAESVRNLGTPVFPRALFDAVLDRFGDDADILTVRDGERPLAGVISLYHRGTVMPYWGGGVWDARALRANEVMYYALMNHAAGRGCTRFDFGRSKFGTGAFAYKKNWGFAPEPLAYAVRSADGQPPRDVNPLSPKYRLQVAAWQRLPLPIANRLGPVIARGLG